MPRYYFDIVDGRNTIDEEGEELADERAAGSMALKILAELLPGHEDAVLDGHRLQVRVLDDERRMRLSLSAGWDEQ